MQSVLRGKLKHHTGAVEEIKGLLDDRNLIDTKFGDNGGSLVVELLAINVEGLRAFDDCLLKS
jgi:hypothetical protein